MEITAKFYSPDDIMEFVKYFGGEMTKVSKAQAKQEPVKEQQSILSQEKEVKEEIKSPETEVTYTLEEVRKKLALLSKEGKKDQVQALLASFEVLKLTELNPADYPSVMEKAMAL
ncbi:MAG: hypothetical protein RR335_08740 [Eubacterium sp.]